MRNDNGQAMTRNFPSVGETMPGAELVSLFERTGHHGFPVIDGSDRLSGIVALSNVERTAADNDLRLQVEAIATR